MFEKCSDVNCIFDLTEQNSKGQHTNGGCSCSRNRFRVQKNMVIIKAEIERQRALIESGIEAMKFYAQGRVDLFRDEEGPTRADRWLKDAGGVAE